MTTRTTLVARGVRGIAGVSPDAAAAIALRLFMRVGPRDRVREDATATMDAAQRSSVPVRGLGRTPVDVVVYTWGKGESTVALTHGWGGRASQFAPLVRDLVSEGFRVVAFDAPAHGESGGRRTYLFDWLDALRGIQDRDGDLHAVIGHSFGALATLLAVVDGLRAERVVTVAAPADADVMLAQFRTALGYDDTVAAALRERFAWRFLPPAADPFARISAASRPLPQGVPLVVVHDEEDRQVPFGEAVRLTTAHPGARLVATTGFGHGRILRSDAFLDAALEAVAAPAAPAWAASRDRTVA